MVLDPPQNSPSPNELGDAGVPVDESLWRFCHTHFLQVLIVDHWAICGGGMSTLCAKRLKALGAHVKLVAKSDQLPNACGYIAADVLVRIRVAALVKGNAWIEEQLPSYVDTSCIIQGNQLLGYDGPGSEARELNAEKINTFVRGALNMQPGEREDWLGGAVS